MNREEMIKRLNCKGKFQIAKVSSRTENSCKVKFQEREKAGSKFCKG